MVLKIKIVHHAGQTARKATAFEVGWAKREREKGIEPSAPTLGRSYSTTELLPQNCRALSWQLPHIHQIDKRHEREKGIEPSALTLARLYSTTELLPQPQRPMINEHKS